MARNNKEISTEVKKEKKKTSKKPDDLKGRTNTKTVTSKRVNVAPAPQAKFVDVDGVKSNYVRVGDWGTPLTGSTVTSTHNTGTTTYIDGSILGNTSSNTAITNLEKNPYTNPEFSNMGGSGQVAYIESATPKEDKLLTFLNSIEGELIELNIKMGELIPKNINDLGSLTYHELFELKRHLADTINKLHYPGSTGNIYMQRAQRRYEVIEGEINNKLNVLFGDV